MPQEKSSIAHVMLPAQSIELEKCSEVKKSPSVGPLWRLPTVTVHTGLSKTEIYRRIKEGTFPRPLKLGTRAVAWPAAEIDAWVKSLIECAAK